MIKKHIPNTITLLNLWFGACALVCVFQEAFLLAATFTGLSLLADFLDGAVARLLKVNSELGVQLDSLADNVSFGLVPGLIFYTLLQSVFPDDESVMNMTALPGFVFSLFACLRLAKFNMDTRQTTSFIGMPTPAATIFVVGLMLIVHFNSFGFRQMVLQPGFLYACIVGLSYLMISEIPMFSLKFERFTWKGNEIKFIFAAVTVAMLFFLREAALSLIILIYAVFSIVQYLLKK